MTTTNTAAIESAAASQLTLTEAHIEAITPAHRAAFSGPVVTTYQVGDTVWMLDHYNTATILERMVDGCWAIRTTDADGEEQIYDYEPENLRPAVAPVEFRWPVEIVEVA